MRERQEVETAPPRRAAIVAALARPVPVESLAAYRILFGTLLFLSTIRFMANGWIEALYVETTTHFTYLGFGWVRVLPEPAMYALYAGIAVSALLVALGLFYRVAIVALLLMFGYAELIDVSNYLNHYYLVVLMAGLMAFLPMHARGSLDARRRPLPGEAPAWMLHLLRFQVAVVYLHAGLAKAGEDWLIHAQPLRIWLAARAETPVFGPLFAQAWAPWVFSWAGFLFDTTIVAWLLWRRSRPFAFAAVLVFHGLTQILFDIGIFPSLMIINATLFFVPDWPSRLRGRAPQPVSGEGRLPRRPLALALAAYAAFQVLFPLRSRLFGGDVLWHEQGMRWSWKVMVREKSGRVTFHVRDRASGRAWAVDPSRYLTVRQEAEMSGQPDLILQLAHRIADDYRREGRDVEVRAEARVSLNGRPSRLMIDPTADLAGMPDRLAPARWILPASEGAQEGRPASSAGPRRRRQGASGD